MNASYYSLIWALLMLLCLLASLTVWIWNWKQERGENAILEGIYILPCLVFGIGGNVVHLLHRGFHGRYIASSLEILCIAGLWIAIFKINMENATPKLCWLRNTIAAFGMWAVMFVLRSYIY